MSRWQRRLARGGLALALVLIIAAAAVVLVLRSGWFANRVRLRIVAEVERATGGKAEIGAFRFDWETLYAAVDDFVLRGTEPPGSEPLFRAKRIGVGLKIISLAARDVDIALLEIVEPRVMIERDEEGNTNLPAPAGAAEGRRDLVTPILKLSIGEFRIADGAWRYASQAGRLDLSGQDLSVNAVYEGGPPAYQMEVTWQQLAVREPEQIPIEFDSSLALTVTSDRVSIERGEFRTADSAVAISGEIEPLDAVSGRFDIKADLAMADLVEPLKLPIEKTGRSRFTGSLRIPHEGGYEVEGTLQAEDLAVINERVRLEGIRATTKVTAKPGRVTARELTAAVLDGRFQGEASLEDWKQFQVTGRLEGLSLQQILPRVHIDGMAWNAEVAGPVEVSGGLRGPVAGRGNFTLTAAEGGLPLEGTVAATFDTAGEGRYGFGESRLTIGTSRVDFSGSLEEGLQVSVYTENLADVLPGLALIHREPPDPFPVRIENGVAQFAGLVTGLRDSPKIAGHLVIGPVRFEGRLLDGAAADFDLDAARLRLRSVTLRQGDTRLTGDTEIGLDDWVINAASPVAGEFDIEQGSVEQLLAEAGQELPVKGKISGTARLSGTVADPAVIARITGRDLSAYDEAIESFTAGIRYSGEVLQVEHGNLRAAGGEIHVQGAYLHQANDWKNGEIRLEVKAGGVRLSRTDFGRELQQGLDAALGAEFAAGLEVIAGKPRLTLLHGGASIADLTLDGRSLGKATLSAETRRNVLIMRAEAGLRESSIRANAEWSLRGDSFGLGQVTFRDLTLDNLQNMGLFGGPRTQIYLDGSFDGEIGFAGPILKPASWRGMAKVTRMALTPVAGENKSDRDLTLRNSGALIFSIEPAQISVISARLASPDTDVTVSGTLSYLRRNPWNLHVKGKADLAALTAFREDLVASGQSRIDAVLRGSLLQPQINGRLEFENGSFYLRNLPNGIDQVNGTILFNRTRATIEKFTSKTGGGDLELSGFIGFGREDWTYRLHAAGKRVRVRYPRGVSTLLDAEIDLTGSSTRSLLSGEVVITRAALNPGSDFGGIITESAGISGPAEVSNPFLRGMQFDLHLTAAPDAELLTSLTRDIEMEADLQLRGSVERPLLIGRVGVNRGELQFFGNRYDILQGEVSFFNPVKIEPLITMDLETRIRGYTVMMNFSGPLDKLSFSYRSDPPLQSQEIIALLTVGRDPTYAGSASTPGPADTGYFRAGGSSFLGHALTAPVSSRLERFFGVSRIKIDPQLTGIENTPETHVTIEQQVSREITLTYVTNLARTQQQIVRIEWNFHPDWSFFAVRDSNGVFGVDFVYRKRFR